MDSSLPAALAALRDGQPVVVLDDRDREAEADLVLAASAATTQRLAFFVRFTGGLICAPMPASWADRLDLPPMVRDNRDPHQTAFTVSVDAIGTGTGISAEDRALTLRILAHPQSEPTSFRRPGHVFPLRAAGGGVQSRRGHTEAAVDLLRLAGMAPVAAICELVHDDGSMRRGTDAFDFAETHGLVAITVEQIVQWSPAASTEPAPAPPRVEAVASAAFPTELGTATIRCYRDVVTGHDHVAEVVPRASAGLPVVRIHSECLTGDVFHSLRCDCGAQLDAARRRIHASGGALIYLRGHEGRGIGLAAKLRAYELQDQGADTVDANLRLGLPVDARAYAAVTAILDDLGFGDIILLTNNTEKVDAVAASGRRVQREPLVVPTERNGSYLATKRDRMGHLLPSDLDGTPLRHEDGTQPWHEDDTRPPRQAGAGPVHNSTSNQGLGPV